MDQICNFFTGDMVTAMTKSAITNKSKEIVLFGTAMGAIGVLLPFDSRKDIDLFSQLEMSLRLSSQSLCGRDHIAYRSFYGPVRVLQSIISP